MTQWSVVSGQKLEIRSQKLEVRSQKSVVRSQCPTNSIDSGLARLKKWRQGNSDSNVPQISIFEEILNYNFLYGNQYYTNRYKSQKVPV